MSEHSLAWYLVKLAIGATGILVAWVVTCLSFAFFGWVAKKMGADKTPRRPLYLGRARKYLKP